MPIAQFENIGKHRVTIDAIDGQERNSDSGRATNFALKVDLDIFHDPFRRIVKLYRTSMTSLSFFVSSPQLCFSFYRHSDHA